MKKIIEKAKTLAEDFTGTSEINRLTGENKELRARERTAVNYIRRKVNQLLMVMGTLPIKAEELDDGTLLELDPIGIIADSFVQVLEHLNETNAKLTVANDEIQAILTAAGVGILVVDDSMRIQAYNPKLRQLFLDNGSVALGETCCRVLCKRDTPPPGCTFSRVVATRRGVHRSDWVFKDRHFEVAAAPIKDKFGEVTRVVLVYNDITDGKRTEEALRESERMYRNLFENAKDLIQCVTPDGSFRYVNPVWCETLGYSADEAAGLAISDILHPDCHSHCMEFFRNLLAGCREGLVAAVFVAKDGREIRVEGNVSCCFADGKPTFTCGIFRKVGE